MLVLARNKGQAIVLSNGVEITIVEIDGGKIRIGIDAPRDVRVLRKELLDPNRKYKRRNDASRQEGNSRTANVPGRDQPGRPHPSRREE